MTRRFRRGLVVGKFAPLHEGHVLLIRSALEHCSQVVIVSYSNPELEFSAPERRELWLAELFPSCLRIVVTQARLREWFSADGPARPPALPRNEAGDDEHREFVAVLLDRLVGSPVDAVFTSEDYGAGFAAHLSRHYRSTNPTSLPVEHVTVDSRRRVVPVSGSQLRRDLWAQWRHLPAPVAHSLAGRVAFVGGESSGKSTLAAAMAQRMDTVSVAEYGRELWEARGGVLAFDDLAAIADEQVRREEAALPGARRWLFCDTSPLTTLFYSLELFGRADPALESAARRPYERVVLCSPDFDFVQDGTRRDPAFRDRQHAWYVAQLTARGMSYSLAEGPVSHRVETLAALLRA